VNCKIKVYDTHSVSECVENLCLSDLVSCSGVVTCGFSKIVQEQSGHTGCHGTKCGYAECEEGVLGNLGEGTARPSPPAKGQSGHTRCHGTKCGYAECEEGVLGNLREGQRDPPHQLRVKVATHGAMEQNVGMLSARKEFLAILGRDSETLPNS